MAGYRPSYTTDEDMKILKSIIGSQLYYSLRGRSFWKDLSAVGHLDRTWMSIQNRFEKYILPNISNPKYTIPDIEKRKIELAWHQTSVTFKKNYKRNKKNIRDNHEFLSTSSSSSEEIDVGSSSVEEVNNESSSDHEIVIDDTDKEEENLAANTKEIAKDADKEGLQNSDESLVLSPTTSLKKKVNEQTTERNSADFATFMESETVEINSNPEHETTNKKLNVTVYKSTDDEGDELFVTCDSS